MTDEESADHERQEAEDTAMFGMDDVKSTGEASVEVTRSNSRKLLWVALAVGAIAVGLVTCISVSVVAYVIMSAKPAATPEDLAKKKELVPPKEMKAKIKNIDRTASTIKFLVGDGKYQTLSVDNATEFLDEPRQSHAARPRRPGIARGGLRHHPDDRGPQGAAMGEADEMMLTALSRRMDSLRCRKRIFLAQPLSG